MVFELAAKRANVRTLFDIHGTQYFVAADLKGIGIDANGALQSRDGTNQRCYYEKGFHWIYRSEVEGPLEGDLLKLDIHPQSQLLTKEGLIQLVSRSKKEGIEVLQKYIQRWFTLMSSAVDRVRERVLRETTEETARRVREETEERMRAEYEVKLAKAAEELQMLSSVIKKYEVDAEKRPLPLITPSNTKLYLYAAYKRIDGKAPFVKVGISKLPGNTRLNQVKKEIRTNYKIDCELRKMCEFDCYDADSAEKLCHKLLQPIHLEDEYFKPYLKYIIYAMKRSCYIVNHECELTNSYIIPYIYTGEEMIDDLYAFMDERKKDEPLMMNVEDALSETIEAFTSLLGGVRSESEILFNQPLAIAMSEEMIEQCKRDAVEGYRREEMEKMSQILIDEGCKIVVGDGGERLIPRRDCVESLGLSPYCPALRDGGKHNLHELDESFHHSCIGFPMKSVVKAALRSRSTRGEVRSRIEKTMIEDPLDGDTLQ